MKSGREGGRGEKRGERLEHYRDQLLGIVSYGICCTKCHEALLHWGSVRRKRWIINYAERDKKVSWTGPTESRKSTERKKGV